jgi:hypothetical protein
MAHEAGRNPKIESQSDLMFVEIVTESETCHIYKVVLLTIKVAARNASEASNSQFFHNIIHQYWMYGYYSMRGSEPV